MPSPSPRPASRSGPTRLLWRGAAAPHRLRHRRRHGGQALVATLSHLPCRAVVQTLPLVVLLQVSEILLPVLGVGAVPWCKSLSSGAAPRHCAQSTVRLAEHVDRLHAGIARFVPPTCAGAGGRALQQLCCSSRLRRGCALVLSARCPPAKRPLHVRERTSGQGCHCCRRSSCARSSRRQ